MRRPPLFPRPISTGVGDVYTTWEEGTELAEGLRSPARFAYPRRVLFEALSRNSSGKVDPAASRRRFGEGGTATC